MLEKKEFPLRIITEVQDWKRPENGCRYAGISSFGIEEPMLTLSSRTLRQITEKLPGKSIILLLLLQRMSMRFLLFRIVSLTCYRKRKSDRRI